jgi:riboflavin kinase
MRDFSKDFYGHRMSVVVLGYIRPELDYTSKGAYCGRVEQSPLMDSPEALIRDIDTDKQVALNSLSRPGYERWSKECPVLDGAVKQ